MKSGLAPAMLPELPVLRPDTQISREIQLLAEAFEGVVTLTTACNQLVGADAGDYATVVTCRHCLIASPRNWRSVRRETRWRWTLKRL